MGKPRRIVGNPRAATIVPIIQPGRTNPLIGAVIVERRRLTRSGGLFDGHGWFCLHQDGYGNHKDPCVNAKRAAEWWATNR